MQSIKIITPYSDTEITNYYQIRFDELRKPWNQPPGSEKDTMEDEYVHRMAVFKDEYIGVARLQYNQDSQAQIRYMAVKKEYQMQGVGKILILDLENIAKNNDVSEIILQSRQSAVDFYLKLNYEIIKKTHLLFDDIQHFLMRKYL